VDKLNEGYFIRGLEVGMGIRILLSHLLFLLSSWYKALLQCTEETLDVGVSRATNVYQSRGDLAKTSP
jgi:hypothetical protein